MDQKFSLLGYLSQVFTIYGVTTLLLHLLCMLFGTSAYGLSTLFSLGNTGISTATSFQFLLAASIIVGLKSVFMTDILIKKMPLAARIITLFASTFGVILTFIFVFGWFPADMLVAWIMFIICYVISCTVSTLISVVAEKQENRRLEEALKRCKEEK